MAIFCSWMFQVRYYWQLPIKCRRIKFFLHFLKNIVDLELEIKFSYMIILQSNVTQFLCLKLWFICLLSKWIKRSRRSRKTFYIEFLSLKGNRLKYYCVKPKKKQWTTPLQNLIFLVNRKGKERQLGLSNKRYFLLS